jgi:hypothetical protein
MKNFALPLVLACLLGTLAACGGGGDDMGGVGVSRQVAEKASENVVVPSDSAQAMSATMSAARFIVGNGSASVTVACSGGGSATWQISGAGDFGNGRFDAGEQYSIVFNNCRSASDGSVVHGSLGFTVTSASGENYTAAATHDVTVTLPQRTTRLSGTSNFVHTEVSSSSGKTTTDRWTASSIAIETTKGSRHDSFSLRNVDLTRTVVSDAGGTVTSRDTRGTCTLVAVIDGVSLDFVWRSDGDVRVGVDGLPLTGAWSLVLPDNVIGLKVRDFGLFRMIEVRVDWFGNGSIDLPIFLIDFGDLL